MDEITVDKDDLLNYMENFESLETVEVPEFKKMMNIPEGSDEMPVIKVRGATLDDHIRAQSFVSMPLMVYRFVLKRFAEEKYFDVDTVEEELRKDTLLPNTRFEISLFHRNVVDPKFTMEDVIELSQTFPTVVNRVCTRILGITQEHYQ